MDDIYLNLLFEKMDGASANIRLFLIRYIRTYGLDKERVLSVDNMVRDLRVHNRAVSEAIRFLRKGSFIALEKVKEGQKGRPLTKYRVGERIRGLLLSSGEGQNRLFLYRERIECLLAGNPVSQSGQEKEQESKGLRSSQILLLCVLYAHADIKGEVHGKSFADLTKLTGLNINQLRNHFKKLKELGYVLPYKPGGGVGSGARKKSVFLLPKTEEVSNSVKTLIIHDPIFDTLQKAILLAHAMKVLNLERILSIEDCSSSGKKKLCPGDYKTMFQMVYQLDCELIDNVFNCMDFLCYFKEINGYFYKAFCRDVCSCVVCILNNSESILNDKKYIKEQLKEIEMIKKYLNKDIKNRKSVIDYIMELVFSLINNIDKNLKLNGKDFSQNKGKTYVLQFRTSSIFLLSVQ